MNIRRKSREYALQILFQYDMTRSRENLTGKFWAGRKGSPPVQDFANRLVEGVLDHLIEIDALIQEYTQHWSLERIATVERNILRVAIFEILFLEDIPAKVSINEAIEITKKYADANSGAFINGILDRIVKVDERAMLKKDAIERGLHAGNRSV